MSGTWETCFDDEVTTRLKVHRDRTLESLSDRERRLLNLTRTELDGEVVFHAPEPRFQYRGTAAPQGYYHLDWNMANELDDTFDRHEHSLATAFIESALGRNLATASHIFDYAAYGSVSSLLEPSNGHSGWLQCEKLSIQSLDVEEFLMLAGRTELGLALDSEPCSKVLLIPATISNSSVGRAIDMSAIQNHELAKRVREVEQRNMWQVDEEVLTLDDWSDNLKQGLEREISDLGKEIREGIKVAALASSLAEKLEVQKMIKVLETNRKENRKRLYEAHDEIDSRRNEQIGKIDGQHSRTLEIVLEFTLHRVRTGIPS